MGIVFARPEADEFFGTAAERAAATTRPVEPLRGIKVANVMPESPASKNDVRAGDMITALNGKPVGGGAKEPGSADRMAFANSIQAMEPGAIVTLTLRRDGKESQRKIALASLPPWAIGGVEGMSGLAPENLQVAATDPPVLKWNAVAGSKRYEGAYASGGLGKRFETEATSYTLPSLQPPNECNWWICAIDENGRTLANAWAVFLPHGWDRLERVAAFTAPDSHLVLDDPNGMHIIGGGVITSPREVIPFISVLQVTRGSPAQKAGIAAGDWIIALDGKPVAATTFRSYAVGDPHAFADQIRGMKPGTVVTCTILRDFKELKIPLTIASAAAETHPPATQTAGRTTEPDEPKASKPAPQPDVGPDQIAVRAVVVSFVRDLLNGDTKSAAGLCLAGGADDPDLKTLAAMCASYKRMGEEAVNRFGPNGKVLAPEESSMLKVVKNVTIVMTGDTTACTSGVSPRILLKRSGKQWKIDLVRCRQERAWQSVQRDAKAIQIVDDLMARDIKAGKFKSPEEAMNALSERIAAATNRQAPEH